MMTTAVIDEIKKLPSNWHGAGTATSGMLQKIANHCISLDSKQYSLETGSGKSTLLMSHIFQKHFVFAVNAGNSISNVKNSNLLRKGVVEFIEGPTQLTLPKFSINYNLDCVLLDGPHGYPFPDLEYYFLYPLLRPGGLLIIDDIHIPSIRRMWDILSVDSMYEKVEIYGNTGFLKKTNQPTTNPIGDEWWTQNYNKRIYDKTLMRENFKKTIVGRLLMQLKEKLYS